jgi:PelA/Pel-15E family pectate lyase
LWVISASFATSSKTNQSTDQNMNYKHSTMSPRATHPTRPSRLLRLMNCAVAALILQITPDVATAATAAESSAQPAYMKPNWQQVATRMPDEWYGSDEAKAVLEIVLKYQTEIGGWAKNTGYQDEANVKQDEWERIKQFGVGATFDNDSTLTEMRFLAKVYAKTKDERCRDAFLKGLEYIFKAQYPNGGWPQYFPYRKNKSAYSSHITYNDDVMVNVMRFLKEISSDQSDFAALKLGEELKRKATQAFDKGLECILKTQIRVNGKPTVWCAQHDEFTLAPVGARSYELASFSGAESVGVVSLLMDIEQPTPEVINAVNGAAKWFNEHKIEGIRVEDITEGSEGSTPADEGEMTTSRGPARDRVVVKDSSAPPLWGRFYDLETGEAYFCDRDAIKKKTLAEIGINRRGGYNWYVGSPARVLERYPAWAKKHGVTPYQVKRVEDKKREELLAQVIREQKEIQVKMIPGQRATP